MNVYEDRLQAGVRQGYRDGLGWLSDIPSAGEYAPEYEPSTLPDDVEPPPDPALPAKEAWKLGWEVGYKLGYVDGHQTAYHEELKLTDVLVPEPPEYSGRQGQRSDESG